MKAFARPGLGRRPYGRRRAPGGILTASWGPSAGDTRHRDHNPFFPPRTAGSPSWRTGHFLCSAHTPDAPGCHRSNLPVPSRMRATRQREAIIRTLEEAGRPLSAVEILHLARSAVPALGLATVYRTIDSLLRSRSVASVEIPGRPPRYELAGKDHHHHFLCRQCHRVFEVPGCPGNIDAHVPDGFVLEGHEITLYGRCAACARLHPPRPATELRPRRARSKVPLGPSRPRKSKKPRGTRKP